MFQPDMFKEYPAYTIISRAFCVIHGSYHCPFREEGHEEKDNILHIAIVYLQRFIHKKIFEEQRKDNSDDPHRAHCTVFHYLQSSFSILFFVTGRFYGECVKSIGEAILVKPSCYQNIEDECKSSSDTGRHDL